MLDLIRQRRFRKVAFSRYTGRPIATPIHSRTAPLTPLVDCILFISFGGPEGPDDVIPFLENVLRGKPVPRERLLQVAQHYMHFGGKSPINEQNRDIIHRLDRGLKESGYQLPIYWGNRNWNPTIAEALQQIKQAGHKLALPVFTNMFSSYPGCRQYRENILSAQSELAEMSPVVAPRLRFGFNHPRFIAAHAELVARALDEVPEPRKRHTKVLFAAHSIPVAMAVCCDYQLQLNESARLIMEALSDQKAICKLEWELVYQSRSGPPSQAWLEPDICDRVSELAGDDWTDAVVVPLGFVSEHLEVLYDLDIQTRQTCGQLGLGYHRSAAVGTHPEFIAMLVDLIAERLNSGVSRQSLGDLPPLQDECSTSCCRASV